MLLEVALVSLLVGAVMTLLIQFLLFRWYLDHTPPQPPTFREQFPAFCLPQCLKKTLQKDETWQQQKEACLWLNMMGQFIFRELRDTSVVRRWVMRRLNLEFQELLQTTSGKLLAQIVVRDFSLGSACPVISAVCVEDIKLDDGDLIQTLDVCMDVDYSGGFTLGVDVVLPFNKMAFISVTVRRLTGRARLQLTRHPYTHWSFSFIQEPEVQFDVESHFEGRPLSQVAALIVNQLRRTIRKKHTLPNYKMRYRPIFPRPEISVPTCRLLVNGQCITVGRLCVTFIKCSRLPIPSLDSTLYCILSADSKAWRELVRRKDKVWVTIEVEISKGQVDSLGLTFKDEYLLDRYGMAVTVDYIQPDSPAARSDVRKGDVLISVGTVRIVSAKHAAKLFKNVGEKFLLKLERPQLKGSQDTKTQEETILFRDVETEMVENLQMEDGEEFVNITMHNTASDTDLTHLADSHTLSDSTNSGIMPSITGLSGSVELSSNSSKSPPSMHVSHSASALLRPRAGTDNVVPAPATVVVNRTKRASTDSLTPTSSPRPKRPAWAAGTQGTVSGSPGVDQNKGAKLGPDGLQGSPRRDRSPSYDRSCTEHLTPEKKPEDEVVSTYSGESDSDDDSSPVMKTREVPASQNPRWHDPLTFDLTEQHAYLNVCVWCHNTWQTDLKGDRPTPSPHRDILLGLVSVPVNMLTLQCLMTMQGDSQQTLELQPGQFKTGVSRKNLAGHINFEPQRCYGDVTLRFQFNPTSLSTSQRSHMTRELDPSDTSSLASVGILPAPQDSSQDEQMSDSEITAGESRHLFAKTQFNSATYCNFCGKKIWLKEAFQCSACGMICHKKCVDKCHMETLCSQDGPRRRSAPGEFWRTPLQTKKQVEEEAGTKPPTRSSRILSKFTRDTASKQAAENDAGKTGGTSPRLLRRHKEAITKVAEESEQAMPGDLQFLHCTLDDTAMTSAKQLGRQLFSQLDIAQRKQRLDLMVNKMQDEIDHESANKVALNHELQEAKTEAARTAVKIAIAKSNEKMEALMLLLLQYCAGLQHCLDQEEELKQQVAAAALAAGPSVSPGQSGRPAQSPQQPQGVGKERQSPPSASGKVREPSPSAKSHNIVAKDRDNSVAGMLSISPPRGEGLNMLSATAEDEDQQTVEVVTQVLNELIHSDSSSSDEDEDNMSSNALSSDLFLPPMDPVCSEEDVLMPVSGTALARAQATLAGIPLDKDSDSESCKYCKDKTPEEQGNGIIVVQNCDSKSEEDTV